MHKLSCPHCEFIFLGDDPPQEGCPACGEDWSAEFPATPNVPRGDSRSADATPRDAERPIGAPQPAQSEPKPAPARGVSRAWLLVIPLLGVLAWQQWSQYRLRNSLRWERQDREHLNEQLTLTRDRLSGAARVLAETQEELQESKSQFEVQQRNATQFEIQLQEERARREAIETVFQGLWQKNGRSFVRNWQLIGPFAYPVSGSGYVQPERLELREPREGLGGSVRWKPFESDSDRINFDQFFKHREAAVCYAASWVYSNLGQEVQLSIGSDDGVCCWVNGVKVHENLVQRAGSPDQDRKTVSFRRGWNEILVRVDNQGSGDWNLFLELRKPEDSKPLKLFSTHLPQLHPPAETQ